MNIPNNVSTLMDLAGKIGIRPLDRLEKGTPVAKGREAVAQSSFKPLVQAVLYLYFDCFDEAHDIAQEHEGSVAGNWIHAIVHRREPDASNSKYWYHRVKLPSKVSQEIAREVHSVTGSTNGRGSPPRLPWANARFAPTENTGKASDYAKASPDKQGLAPTTNENAWDPIAFVDLCETTRKKSPADPTFQTLVQMQHIEWKALLEFVLSS